MSTVALTFAVAFVVALVLFFVAISGYDHERRRNERLLGDLDFATRELGNLRSRLQWTGATYAAPSWMDNDEVIPFKVPGQRDGSGR